jgi:hypothetical protein
MQEVSGSIPLISTTDFAEGQYQGQISVPIV